MSLLNVTARAAACSVCSVVREHAALTTARRAIVNKWKSREVEQVEEVK